MKKIIPFKKEIIMNTSCEEITNISLEHSLEHHKDQLISGILTVSGEYKITHSSISVDNFSYELPFEINMDEKYDITSSVIDIDDFYYELINNKVLEVSIDISVDNIKEIEIKEEPVIENIIIEDKEEIKEETMNIKEERDDNMEEPKERNCIEEETKSLLDNIDQNEVYKSYKIYIVREGDTVESIMQKYNISKEELENYNDLKDFNVNNKIIIPNTYQDES